MTLQFWGNFSFLFTFQIFTFQFWSYFGFYDISVFVTFQFWWAFSFGDILILVTFQFWWDFSFGNNSILVTFFALVQVWFVSVLAPSSAVSCSPFQKMFFFQKHTPSSPETRNLFQRWHLKVIVEKNHWFEKSGALQIKILLKVFRCLAF